MFVDDFEEEEFKMVARELVNKAHNGEEISSMLGKDFDNKLIRWLENPERKGIRPDVSCNSYSPSDYRGGKKGEFFRSLGEQLISVYQASQPGGRVDERLYKVAEKRAASGLSEGVPSDGGSNPKAPHGSNAMMNNPQIQGSLNYARA